MRPRVGGPCICARAVRDGFSAGQVVPTPNAAYCFGSSYTAVGGYLSAWFQLASLALFLAFLVTLQPF